MPAWPPQGDDLVEAKKRGPYKELKAEKGEPAGPRVGGDVSW